MIEECASLYGLGTQNKYSYVSLTAMAKSHQVALISSDPKDWYTGICISQKNNLVGMQADFPQDMNLEFTAKAVCKF